MSEMRLFSPAGERLYLTSAERKKFENACYQQPTRVKSLGLVLLHTGCRISEALALQFKHIDFEAKAINIESLKKRKHGVFRSVPVAESMLNMLNDIYKIQESKNKNNQLWRFVRMTASRHITEIMDKGDISGKHATAKGLRHGFGVHAIAKCQVPLNVVQKWLGHADMKTTAIYTNAIGDEERKLAERMWR